MSSLFSDWSLWTMVHGIVLGGAALLALFAALFALRSLSVMQAALSSRQLDAQARAVSQLLVTAAVLLWATAISGTYIVFPPYRAAPPEGATDLAAYPRSMLLADPETAWLHAFAMESKEHMPWTAAMLATAVAVVAVRHRRALLTDDRVKSASMTLLAVCFVLAAFAGVLGILVNKAAPLG